MVARIHRKVVKQGKRHAVYRFILAKGDKEKIVSWKQDLVRVLHVFNVRSNGLMGIHELTRSIQTELAIDTNMTVTNTQTMVADARVMVSDTQTTVTDTHITVSDTQIMVADTQTMVADIHRKVLTGRESTSGQNDAVGATCFPSRTECLPSFRLKLGQQC
jgi:hypothetical protein